MAGTSDTLRSCQSLSDSDFYQACSDLIQRFQDHASQQKDWLSIELISDWPTSYLRITKELHDIRVEPENEVEHEIDDCEEDDDEVLQIETQPQTLIHYDITMSQTYRVPALYFSISGSQHRFPTTMDTLYRHVIPPQFKAQAESVGVIGGITIHEHPATGRPVFYIHPCRTAELMHASAGGRNICALDYLFLWIGALGKCVGLDIPLALAKPQDHRD